MVFETPMRGLLPEVMHPPTTLGSLLTAYYPLHTTYYFVNAGVTPTESHLCAGCAAGLTFVEFERTKIRMSGTAPVEARTLGALAESTEVLVGVTNSLGSAWCRLVLPVIGVVCWVWVVGAGHWKVGARLCSRGGGGASPVLDEEHHSEVRERQARRLTVYRGYAAHSASPSRIDCGCSPPARTAKPKPRNCAPVEMPAALLPSQSSSGCVLAAGAQQAPVAHSLPRRGHLHRPVPSPSHLSPFLLSPFLLSSILRE